MLTYIDLFAGSGGWDSGLSALPLRCKGLYELNPSACQTLRFNHDVKVFECDLSEYELLDFPNVDFIIGSPPCQGFSNEGKKNKEDPRNSLVWSFLDIVKKLNPNVWIFENVPGFKRLYQGEYYDLLSTRLEKMDYNWNSFILDSSDYGVPQVRKRFIAVGSKKSKPMPPPPTFCSQKNLFDLPLKRTFWDAISDLPYVLHGEKVGVFDYTKDAHNDFQDLMRSGSSKVYNHTTQSHSDRVLQKISAVPMGGNMASIVSKFKENKKHYEGGYRRAQKDVPSYTAYWTRGMTSIHPEIDRFLSPRECARIQSFPDKIIFQGTTIENYTQICNAVPPLLSRAIVEHVINNYL